jgi:hypothetical protein
MSTRSPARNVNLMNALALLAPSAGWIDLCQGGTHINLKYTASCLMVPLKAIGVQENAPDADFYVCLRYEVSRMPPVGRQA